MLYCSPSCRAAARRRQAEERRAGYGTCEEPGCPDRKRSAGARWCEKHYGRVRRGGEPSTTRVRVYTGICHHCGGEAPRQRLFCSELCRRRNRMGAPGRQLTCTVCGTLLPERVRLDAMYCTLSCQRTAERAKRYGLPAAQMFDLLAKADGCEICGNPEAELVVDHCHASGRVRGLLCNQCNVGVGMFLEDPDRMRAAIRYLEEQNPAGPD